MAALGLHPALLEDWMRDYYFSTEIDIGSSGVEDYSLRDLAEVERVLLVPGDCFGAPGYVRLGFGSSTGHLEEGLLRLSRALVRQEAELGMATKYT